jgi:preprotein translocase subunit YajC
VNHFVMLMGAPAGGGGTGGNPLLGFLPLIAIIVIMYFLMIRPQAKKQKEHKAMLEALKKGDRVITAGGILGTIAGIKENENIVIVKIAENVKVELSRGSIGQVIQKQ